MQLLAPRPGFNPRAAWSSDGKRVAFVTGDGYAISTARPDGTGSVEVAHPPQIHGDRQWYR